MSELRALNRYNCHYNNDNFRILKNELNAIVRDAGLNPKKYRKFVTAILNQCTSHALWYFGVETDNMTYASVIGAIQRHNVSGVNPTDIMTLAEQYIETFQ
jgi:hypothetical protein